MEKQPTKIMQAYAALLAITGWVAVILQFYLILLNRTASVAETVVRFFSFFTILTNILVAVCCTVLWLRPGAGRSGGTGSGGWLYFFAKPATLTAITVYITIVGLVYNIVLRILWEPQGLQLWVDELLHTVIPFLFIIFWMVFVLKGGLRWKDVPSWLIYPIVYTLFIMVRGALSGFYPYPFIDLNKIATHEVFINAGAVLVGFLVLSLVLVGIGKLGRLTRDAQ
ncbi:MAG TPA: Pr6Pr family membrane protein [Puia sp.]